MVYMKDWSYIHKNLYLIEPKDTFEVSITKVGLFKPIVIGEFDALDEEDAKGEAAFEIGLHESRFFNADNIDFELSVKKIKEVV